MKVRAGGRVDRALVVAYGVDQSGQREVIGLDVGAAETEAFWRKFLRSLVRGGLLGVQLVISDAHEASRPRSPGAELPWQRCTVHFLRDALGHCPKDLQQLVGAAIRPIFRAGSLEQARRLLGETATHLEARVPKVARLLLEAEPDLLGFSGLPAPHRSKLRSTNPLERVNREIGRRTDVVGCSPRRRLAPSGGQPADRAERRVAGRPPLPQRGLNGRAHHPDPTTGKELQVA